MASNNHGDDIRAIEAVISRQFSSLSWASGATADWQVFTADFLPSALLYPAARPLKHQTVNEFVERMKGLVGKTLHSFQETVLGTEVHVFGNVAVAVAACEMVENGAEVNRGVEMMLLVKEEGTWRIVSQAWDKESPSNPIPDNLLSRGVVA
jgi:hypothetical protein